MKASIIIATKNRSNILARSLNAMLSLDFDSFEIIVANDGSTDSTKSFLEDISSKTSKIKALNFSKSRGPAFARNRAIEQSKGRFIVIMDDDCIPQKKWLSQLLKPFEKNKNIGITSSFNYFGGTSTAYRGTLLQKIGLFDESFPFNYREDTDSVFKILDLGYKVEMVKAPFDHFHKQPENFLQKIKYGFKRLWMHHVDPLIFKKHPVRGKNFFDVKLGFIRNPVKDFEVATGLWWKRSPKLSLSSPQGVKLIENKSPLHFIIIILGGIFYAVAIKFVRLYGSIKYGKLLV